MTCRAGWLVRGWVVLLGVLLVGLWWGAGGGQPRRVAYAAPKPRKPGKRRVRRVSRQQVKRWSAELARLRAEVERLSGDIQAERASYLMALRGLEGRRNQLQLMVDQERLQVRRLRVQVGKLRSLLQTRRQAQTAIRAALLDALQHVTRAIRQSLPYRRKERMKLVTQIKAQMGAGRLDAEQGVAKLWRILEDELRMTTLVERAELPLRLGKGKRPRLVKVVRVGMIAMLVDEGEGRFGRIVRGKGGHWGYEAIQDVAQRKEVKRLFVNLERQIREGRYRLPLLHVGRKP